ncbi:class I SAM-dependent methyltransferase [Candidatus Parcubacteria bacterium]|nr:class I SAM-dependent methyltransferase [Candidatus Parcubacteria bacterium]
MDKKFIKNFIKKSKEIYQSGENFSWAIPMQADKYKGDFGLLPEDEEIRSWQIPPASAMLLRFLVLSQKAKNILELGASVGYSTIWLALAAKETGGHVHTTEIFKDKARIAKENFQKAGISNFVTLHEEKIFDVLNKWPKEKKIDFVFMDADKQNYGKYLKIMYPLLSDGAMIVVDNVGDYPEHMEKFLDMCRNIENAATYMLEFDHGLFMFVKGVGKNLLPYLSDELPLFKANALKVLLKDKELNDFWKKYFNKKVLLRADVLVLPKIVEEIKNVKNKKVLLLEWGPGVLSENFAKKGAIVTKVDLASQEKNFKNIKRSGKIKFVNSKNIKLLEKNKEKFDLVISYMFQLYLPKDEIIGSIKILKNILKDNGEFIFSDIQPFRAIVKNKTERGVISLHNPFHSSYLQFTQLNAKLRASNGDSLLSTYNHYPMSFLLNLFAEHGFNIKKLVEPITTKNEIKRYPVLFSDEDMRIPPYIVFKLTKN